MSIKINLLSWAVRTFGELDPSDVILIEERIVNTDNPKIIQQKIELLVKKRIGKDENWQERAKIEDWDKYLKELVGPHLTFDMKDNEGRERRKMSGMIEGNYKQSKIVQIYNYQFSLIVVKARKITEKSHVGTKPKH